MKALPGAADLDCDRREDRLGDPKRKFQIQMKTSHRGRSKHSAAARAGVRRSDISYSTPALLWQPGDLQRTTERFRKRWGTVHASKLAAVAKGRLKLEHARGRCSRFVQTAEPGQRGGQLHISDAMCRIGLNGLVGRTASFFVTPTRPCMRRRPLARTVTSCSELSFTNELSRALTSSVTFGRRSTMARLSSTISL